MARLFAVAWAVAAAAGCTQSSTSLAEPSSTKCQITATNQPSSFPAGGGRGAVSVGATRDCAWSIAANAPWVAISGERSGRGDAVVNYSVSENPVPSARNAMLTVDAVQLSLSQAAAPCTYDIAPLEASISAAGGTVSVVVTTLTGCTWTAAANVSWIGIANASGGSASATLALTVGANPGGARDGTVSLAGRTFTVRQAGASGSPSPPGPPPPPPPPEPAPAPAPPPEVVEFEGVVIAMSGECPRVNFIAAGRVVVTEGSTEFKKGRCRDLSVGDRVKVRGTVTSSGAVAADRVEFKEENG